jgi:hypothetical protein
VSAGAQFEQGALVQAGCADSKVTYIHPDFDESGWIVFWGSYSPQGNLEAANAELVLLQAIGIKPNGVKTHNSLGKKKRAAEGSLMEAEPP